MFTLDRAASKDGCAAYTVRRSSFSSPIIRVSMMLMAIQPPSGITLWLRVVGPGFGSTPPRISAVCTSARLRLRTAHRRRSERDGQRRGRHTRRRRCHGCRRRFRRCRRRRGIPLKINSGIPSRATAHKASMPRQAYSHSHGNSSGANSCQRTIKTADPTSGRR